MTNAFANVPASDRIIVALDCGRDEAVELAEKLRGRAKWVKVGMTLYYACGPSVIAAFKQRGYKVFLVIVRCLRCLWVCCAKTVRGSVLRYHCPSK